MDRQTDDPIHRAEFPAALVRSGRGEIGAARAVLGAREYPGGSRRPRRDERALAHQLALDLFDDRRVVGGDFDGKNATLHQAGKGVGIIAAAPLGHRQGFPPP